jgi:hypothetical protein
MQLGCGAFHLVRSLYEKNIKRFINIWFLRSEVWASKKEYQKKEYMPILKISIDSLTIAFSSCW